MTTNDLLATLEAFEGLADLMTGQKAALIHRGWSEAAAEALVVALVVKR